MLVRYHAAAKNRANVAIEKGVNWPATKRDASRPTVTITPMSVNDQLARITKSPPLVSSPSLCRFLRYIVEETLAGRASGIKEQVLGLEVFDRGMDFNPRLDPI